MPTLQQLANKKANESKRFYRVSLWKQETIELRKNDSAFTNDDPNLIQNYERLFFFLNETLSQLRFVHDEYDGWATKWGITWPTGELLTTNKARLRTLLASRDDLAPACRNQGFTPEDFPSNSGKYYKNFYRVLNWFITDVLRVQARNEYYIAESEALYPDTAAEEFTPLIDKEQALLGQARYETEALIQTDAGRRGITTIDNFQIGDAVYGKRMKRLNGGLYLLNGDVVCTPPVDINGKKAEIVSKLPDLFPGE